MAAFISDNIRRLLSEYTFEIDPNFLNEDLTCTICKKLVIDVYQSYCGCNYCQCCISDYLTGENKYCPGEKKECKEEYLLIGKNVSICPKLNKKIANITIRCPNESCSSVVGLMEMEEHVRVCSRRASDCPYIKIGCENGKGSKDSIIDHLHNEAFIHSKLLIEWVEVLKNEMNGFKENLNLNKLEIISLKEELERKETKIGKIMEELEVQKKEIDDVKEDLKIKEIKMDDMEDEMMKIIKENAYLKSESKIIKDDIEILEKGSAIYMMEIRSNISTIKEKTEQKKKVEEISPKSKEIEPLKKEIETLNVYSPKETAIGEISFIMDDFKMKKTSTDRIIFSPYFFSHKNGYKIRLKVYPGGCGDGKGTHLSVFLVICKGEYDDVLPWPCKRAFKISIINQCKKKGYRSITIDYLSIPANRKYSFKKPIGKDNDGYGYHSFVSREDLESINGLTVDDTVVIKCIAKAPT